MKAIGVELNSVWQYRIWFAAFLYIALVVETVVRFVRHRRGLSAPRVATNLVILSVEIVMRAATFSLRYAAGLWLAILAPMHWRWAMAPRVGRHILLDPLYYFPHPLPHFAGWGWA